MGDRSLPEFSPACQKKIFASSPSGAVRGMGMEVKRIHFEDPAEMAKVFQVDNIALVHASWTMTGTAPDVNAD